MPRVLRLCAALILATTCGGRRTAPRSSGKPEAPPALRVRCAVSVGLACSATLFGEGDVTERASWTAAGSFREAMDLPVPASDAVTFPAPGVVRAHRAANVYIRADYQSPRWGHVRDIAPFAYGLSPEARPEVLAYLVGITYLGSGPDVLGGVTVEVVEGASTGRRAASRDHGSYMLEFLPVLSPLLIRASKAGYVSDTRGHPGIAIDSNFATPTNTTVLFHLAPGQ